jgi:hypothetical protein
MLTIGQIYELDEDGTSWGILFWLLWPVDDRVQHPIKLSQTVRYLEIVSLPSPADVLSRFPPSYPLDGEESGLAHTLVDRVYAANESFKVFGTVHLRPFGPLWLPKRIQGRCPRGGRFECQRCLDGHCNTNRQAMSSAFFLHNLGATVEYVTGPYEPDMTL